MFPSKGGLVRVIFKICWCVMGVAWAVCGSAMHIIPIRYEPKRFGLVRELCVVEECKMCVLSSSMGVNCVCNKVLCLRVKSLCCIQDGRVLLHKLQATYHLKCYRNFNVFQKRYFPHAEYRLTYSFDLLYGFKIQDRGIMTKEDLYVKNVWRHPYI